MSEVASGSFEWPAWRKGCKAANSILYTRIWKKAVSKRPFLVWKGCMKRPKELILSSISYRSQGIIKFRSLLNIESVLPQKFASMIWGFESDTCESMQKMRLLWSLGLAAGRNALPSTPFIAKNEIHWEIFWTCYGSPYIIFLSTLSCIEGSRWRLLIPESGMGCKGG